MDRIILKVEKHFEGSVRELSDFFESKVIGHNREIRFANSEASILWIIRGCIGYFDKLSSDFLGVGNASGIPSIEADSFANNVYRLNNAMRYLSELWNFAYDPGDGFKLLLDIRTLIVHSGQPVTSVLSLELEGYKDSQLGRIFKRGEDEHTDIFSFQGETSNMDYVIQIWSDKHAKIPKNQKAVVDFHEKNESYKDIELFLKSDDVREIVLNQISCFIQGIPNMSDNILIKRMPPIDYLMRDESIDFEKIADIVANDTRGGYIIEDDESHWDGYGLQRLWNYVTIRTNISLEVKNAIKERIKERIE